ncbi:TetR/AcrR family transcriptional regulator [Streptomyces swartbergensis]|uniref:TetR family transcriptional regulator n=1 Tax=Streptomyces swartbergensis TaxID=487165 RepID=A0A243RA14_9ACTN|nr:TetR/AcrR family transcriptional regulator [Streptomyces swartbergensis]OUC91481.1 TetR family transcriptional regulator [Streptomyces swartbergensis]
MPKLWNETIDAHRAAVREAILDTTAKLVAEGGLRSVTMSQVAERTGIGRATLYKYFSDAEAVLLAWHERQIAAHLEQLSDISHQTGTAVERLTAVLEAYAGIARQRHGGELAALLHQGEHVTHAEQHLQGMLQHLLAQAAQAGDLRSDVPPAELAQYCLHALTAAAGLTSQAAVTRLVSVTLDGLRPHSLTY